MKRFTTQKPKGLACQRLFLLEQAAEELIYSGEYWRQLAGQLTGLSAASVFRHRLRVILSIVHFEFSLVSHFECSFLACNSYHTRRVISTGCCSGLWGAPCMQSLHANKGRDRTAALRCQVTLWFLALASKKSQWGPVSFPGLLILTFSFHTPQMNTHSCSVYLCNTITQGRYKNKVLCHNAGSNC